MKLFTHLEIETIGSCNRRCPTCLRESFTGDSTPTHDGRTVEKKIGAGNKMPLLLFKNIVAQAANLGFEGNVGFQHYNEPLLDDRLPRMMDHVRVNLPKSTITFCTNGDFFTPALAAEIDHVDQINIALYMPVPAQNKRERYLRSLFTHAKLRFTRGHHVITHFSPEPGLQDKIDQVIDRPCTTYNHMLIIAYTGEVLHCCDDYAGHFGLGNVNIHTIKDIWFSKKHEELVETLAHRGGRRKLPYCESCPRA